jgi:hypothetical protein
MAGLIGVGLDDPDRPLGAPERDEQPVRSKNPQTSKSFAIPKIFSVTF